MKAKCLFLAMSLMLILASCDNGTTSGDNVPGSTLAEKLEWLQTNAETGGSYVVEVSADEVIAPNQRLEYSNRNNITITLKGSGGNRIISIANNGSMFLVRTGVTLILDNITLSGRRFNTNPLVHVRSGAALRMNNGATITGNTAGNTATGSGGGVLVEGTFTMNGGTISGNAATNDGGGVNVSGGTFTMNGGTISGNTANNDGGGVNVLGRGTFIMSGGTISGNEAKNGGGGASVQFGNFTMNGGTISGNNSEKDGGGVYAANARNSTGTVLGIGTFTMSGGTISGNTARENGGGVSVANEGTFIMNRGNISGNIGVRGGGVSVTASTAFTMSDGIISGNTARIGGGGVFVWGAFTKTGGTITGYDSDRRGNVVSNSPGTVEIESGYTVFATNSTSRITKRKETTAGPGVNLSYTGRTGLYSGEWDF